MHSDMIMSLCTPAGRNHPTPWEGDHTYSWKTDVVTVTVTVQCRAGLVRASLSSFGEPTITCIIMRLLVGILSRSTPSMTLCRCSHCKQIVMDPLEQDHGV